MPNRDAAPAEFTRSFAVRLTPELDDALRAFADDQELSIADVVRQALTAFLPGTK